jgi:hypothetical protein
MLLLLLLLCAGYCTALSTSCTVRDHSYTLCMLAAAVAAASRRLLHFSVVDEAGELQHLDRLELLKKPISLTGGFTAQLFPQAFFS